MKNPLYPPTIIYGREVPDIRLKQKNGNQIYFCRNNANLHLMPDDFDDGTYEMGTLLGALCRKHCVPQRQAQHAPCPAFVESWKYGKLDDELASVKMRPLPQWEECRGVQALLDHTQTKEERFFLRAYLEDKYTDESTWRDDLIERWNAHWISVPEGWGETSRRGRFEQMLWWTIRYPALIPQFWLNWLANASDAEMRLLDANPSRVDFLAFWRGERHVIEIDGPSHYAAYDGNSYKVDERAYARNLKIERTLRGDGWHLTRIARIEVRQAMADDFLGTMTLLATLPFYPNDGYDVQLPAAHMGLPEIDKPVGDFVPNFVPSAADDDIPF